MNTLFVVVYSHSSLNLRKNKYQNAFSTLDSLLNYKGPLEIEGYS